MGNLTRDPEMKYTPKGTAICDIGLAVNRVFTVGDEKREEVTFVDVTLWGRVAEIVGEYCKKGRPLFVQGRLQLDQWDDKQTGQKRSKLKVIGENIQLLGSKDGGGTSPEREDRESGRTDRSGTPSGRSGRSEPPRRPATPPPRPADPDLDPPEDDIPF